MVHIYRRIIDPATGEFRRGEYVGYVDTSHHVLDGAGPRYNLDGTPMDRSPDPPTVRAKPRLGLVADLQEFRAWRRQQRAHRAQTYGHFDLETP